MTIRSLNQTHSTPTGPGRSAHLQVTKQLSLSFSHVQKKRSLFPLPSKLITCWQVANPPKSSYFSPCFSYGSTEFEQVLHTHQKKEQFEQVLHAYYERETETESERGLEARGNVGTEMRVEGDE